MLDIIISNCKSLKSLDLNHFYTPKLENMTEMFAYCISMESLDISNFNTSKVKNMYFTFALCEKLSSLDLSSFVTPNVQTMHQIVLKLNHQRKAKAKKKIKESMLFY